MFKELKNIYILVIKYDANEQIYNFSLQKLHSSFV